MGNEIQKKILARNEGAEIGKKFRDENRTLVFTNGCFDVLHPGHIDLLTKSRAFGDALMVGLNTDSSVKRLKGKNRPIFDEKSRALMLASLEMVSYVVFFDEDTPEELIKSVRPKVLVKGGDYSKETIVGADYVESDGGRVEIIPLVAGFSSTEIIMRILSL